MTTTTYELEGSGALQPESAGGVATKPVKYSFVIRQTIVTKPGLPAAPARADGRGTVSLDDGTSLPEGLYRLTLSDGKQIRVQNIGGQWHILAPLVG